MIKANDLRLGNYILHDGSPYKVVRLNDAEVSFFNEKDKCRWTVTSNKIEPIELTADILGKIKDVKVESDKRFLYDTADWSIYFVKAELPKWELHWLQNYIYFRTGIELSITL